MDTVGERDKVGEGELVAVTVAEAPPALGVALGEAPPELCVAVGDRVGDGDADDVGVPDCVGAPVTLPEAVCDCEAPVDIELLGVAAREGVQEAVGEPLGLGVVETDAVGDRETVAVADAPPALGVTLGEAPPTLCVADGEKVGLEDGVPVAAPVELPDAVRDGDAPDDSELLGDAGCEGVPEAVGEPLGLREAVGEPLALCVTVGDREGESDGLADALTGEAVRLHVSRRTRFPSLTSRRCGLDASSARAYGTVSCVAKAFRPSPLNPAVPVPISVKIRPEVRST